MVLQFITEHYWIISLESKKDNIMERYPSNSIVLLSFYFLSQDNPMKPDEISWVHVLMIFIQ